MVRRHQHKKWQTRKAQAEARRGADSGRGTYKPPARADGDALDWFYYAGETESIRVHTYIWRHNGRLADFAIVFMASGTEEEEEVERIDCAHGHCHLHTRTGGCTGLMPLADIADVQRAYDITEALAQDRARILLERED